MTTPRGGPGRQRPAPLRAVVVRREQLSPTLIRVTVTGPEFHRYKWVGPAAHFKLLLPEPGAEDVVLPGAESGGMFAPGGPRPTMRTYTARSFDEATAELDIDFVLHGHGPASSWAASAEPGGRLAVSMPRAAGFTEDPAAEWTLIVGDGSALPAVSTIVATLTKPATVIVEVDPADRLDIRYPVTWVSGPPSGPGLRQAVADFVRPPGRGQFWIAAEATLIRSIRADLLATVASEQLTTRGYWRVGEQNHPDHDYGDAERN